MKTLAICLLTIAAPLAAAAQTGACRGNPHLTVAQGRIAELDYERASQALGRAILHSPNCRADLATIYRLKGAVDAINGERERSVRSFAIFLALSPAGTTLPSDTPTKVKALFQEALAIPVERRTLTLEASAPAETAPKTAVTVTATLHDPMELTEEVRLYFRRQGLEMYTMVHARVDRMSPRDVSLVMPALAIPADGDGYVVEYFVGAVDRWSGALAEVGSYRAPLRLTVLAAR